MKVSLAFPRNIAWSVSALAVSFISFLPPSRADENWPQFRGPNGQGVADEANPPEILDLSSNQEWVVDLPEAYSSVVVWDDRIYVTGVKENFVHLIALRARDGAVAWDKAIEPQITDLGYSPENGHRASSTPAVDAKLVVVYSFHAGLMAYDHEGNLKWKRELPPPRTRYFPATSPILHDGRVFLCLDGKSPRSSDDRDQVGSRLYALNATDGSTIWEASRPFGTIGNGTPIIREQKTNGAVVTELLMLGGTRLTGYDLGSGEMNWWVTGFAAEANTTPVVAGDLVIGCAISKLGISGNSYEGPPWGKFLEFDQDHDGSVVLSDLPEDFVFLARPELPAKTPQYGARPFKDFGRSADQNKDGKLTKQEFENMLKQFESSAKPQILAAKPEGRGDLTDSAVAWLVTKGVPEAPSLLYYRHRLYSVRDGGIVSCYEPTSGRVLFTERLGAPGLYTASPVAARNRIYFCSASGVVTVIQAGDEFKKLSQTKIGEPVYGTPALAGNNLYLRSLSRLHAFTGR